MTENSSGLLARHAWQAVADSDVETLKQLWHENIVWHVTGDNPWQGDHVGHDAVLEYLASVGESGDSYDMTLIDVLSGKDYAGLICHVSTKRGDRVMEVDQLLLCRIEDRRIAEAWTLSTDPQMIRNFWG